MASNAKEEYNTNIPDKEERKKVRRDRVDARNASEDKEAGSKVRGGANGQPICSSVREASWALRAWPWPVFLRP